MIKLSELDVSSDFWEDVFVTLANLPTEDWWAICDQLGKNSADTEIEEIIDMIKTVDAVEIRNGFTEVFIAEDLSVRVMNTKLDNTNEKTET